MVVDQCTGIADITQDVRRGHLQAHMVASLLLFVGVSPRLVLEGLVDELKDNGFQGKLTVTGLLPVYGDSAQFCRWLTELCKELYDFTQGSQEVTYAHVGEVVCNARGIIPELLNVHGLMHDGWKAALFTLKQCLITHISILLGCFLLGLLLFVYTITKCKVVIIYVYFTVVHNFKVSINSFKPPAKCLCVTIVLK